ncbi:C4-dicarboxylate TRAP transporter substrate-binding protein [Futiania mangrovi]|uniref:C4-dicarboxylate TRAP transporter substrate-binding protein n=1 Tax=Futiania mangrovi TaxID=2959716 RepID=A0A9J6PK96_9PROT|nr:C4-dicarboxylate TRAP transporter substrate-binding protein [Futiania mangrovii]MCP1336983.1 C4-dicarboxylate TRAP transporter substrate-binding protein [Futiania mangrovii]
MKLKSLVTGTLAFACASALSVGAAQAQTEVRATNWHPPKHPVVTGGYEPFVKHVEEISNGSLKIKLWSGGSLVKAKETLPGLQNGIADIGMLALSYFPAEFPYSQMIADFGMMSSDPLAASAAVTEFVMLQCQPCRDEFTKRDIVFTGVYSTSPYTLISKGDYNSPEALAGKKFRSGGALWNRWIASVNGTAINVPSSEMFETMDRGGVDIAIMSSASLSSFSLWDVASYNILTKLGTYQVAATFALSKEFWEGLNADQRKAILDGAALGNLGTTLDYMALDEKALAQAKEKGVTVLEPSAELARQIQDFVAADLKTVAETAKTKHGVADPDKWIAAYRELLTKWEGLMAQAGGDREKMLQALRDEIFSKVDVNTYGL